MRPRLATGLVLIFACVTAAPARSQTARPQPRLQAVMPPGGRAGTTVEVLVTGAELAKADGLWFSGGGIAASPVPGKPGAFRVEIAGSVKVGVFDVRVLTPDGVTNPRAFVVGNRPESVEAEPNNARESATTVRVGAVANGTITATDLDWYRFAGKAGQRVIVDLAADRIDSKLDATIRLVDARGVELAGSRDAVGIDPFLDVRLPSDGDYFLKVHDVTYEGSAEHVYRLTVHDGPHLDAIVPAVALDGQTGRFRLIGRNLGGIAIPDRAAEDGRPLETKEINLTAHASDASHLAAHATGTMTTLRGQDVRFETERGTSNSVVLAEADAPVVEEREPDGFETPQEVTPPCAISGGFQKPSDIDIFRFRARGGETWRVEATAEGIGSMADPSILIQRVGDKGEIEDVANSDDTAEPTVGGRLNLSTVDASIAWKVPRDGLYQVAIADVAGRGGPRYPYRLSIRRPRPDFRLFLVHPTANQLEGLAIRKPGRAAALVIAWRREGFAAPIWVTPEGLPAGVRCDPVVIARGQVVAPVVFEADASTPIGAGPIRLVGRSRWPEPIGLSVAHEAVPVSTIWPLDKRNANSKATIAPFRAVRGFVAAVRDGSPFLLTVRPIRAVVVAGQAIDLEVKVKRSPKFANPIQWTAADLPPGLAPPTGTLAKDDTATLAWAVPKGFATGDYTMNIRGTSTYQPDPKGPNFKVDEPSNAFAIRVIAPPVEASIVEKAVSAAQGKPTTITLKLDRANGFVGPISVKFEFPAAARLAADPIVAGPEQKTLTIPIRASTESPVSPKVEGTIRLAMTVGGLPVEMTVPIVAAVTKP